MAQDPRLGLTARNPAEQLGRELAEIKSRISNLERANPAIQQLTGAPTTSPRDGTAAVDTTGTGRLWVRVAGAWVFTPLLSSPPAPTIARGQVTLTWAASTTSGVATVPHNLGVTPASVVLTVYNNGLANVTVGTVGSLSNTQFQCFGLDPRSTRA